MALLLLNQIQVFGMVPSEPLDGCHSLCYNGRMATNRHNKSHTNSQAPTLRRMLKQGKTVYVEFVKQDGTIRKMICTTNMSKVPFCKHPTGAGMDYDESQIRVFDLVKQDWRSMIDENVEMVSVIE